MNVDFPWMRVPLTRPFVEDTLVMYSRSGRLVCGTLIFTLPDCEATISSAGLGDDLSAFWGSIIKSSEPEEEVTETRS